MKLSERFFNFVFERLPKDVQTAATKQNVVSSSGQQPGLQREVTDATKEFDKVSIRHDRRRKIQEVSEMINVDGRYDRLLYKLASDANHGDFSVQVESADTDAMRDEAQYVIDRTKSNINTKENMKGWIKGVLRDGDLFLQLAVDSKEMEVLRAKKLAAQMTFSRLTPEGKLPKDEKPYYQEDPLLQGEVIREFDGWEIVHLKWDAEDGVPYGKPILASSRLAWRRLDAGEKNVAIRRAVRSGQRRHHKIGNAERTGTPDEVERYKQENQDTLSRPLTPTQDFYSNGLVDIMTLEGDGDIGQMDDVKYFEGIPWIAAGVPQSVTGGGREAATNLNVVKAQEEDYLRVIHDINLTLEAGFRHIFDFALLLKGINPESVVYVFKWGAKDREDINAKIERGAKLQELGYSFETVFKQIGLDGVDFEEEMKRIEDQVARSIIPYGINTKLDPTLAALLSAQQNMQTNETLEALKQLKPSDPLDKEYVDEV